MARPKLLLWGSLAASYLAFLSWYGYSAGPLTPDEIDRYEAILETQGLEGTQVREALRTFAENDDGDEFFMVNLENFRDEPELPEGLPEDADPVEAEQRYSLATGRKLLLRASHPVLSLRGRTNFIEYEGAPVWEHLLLVRYRSRRDFLEIFTHPETAAGIHFKWVFFQQYHAWPTEMAIAAPPLRTGLLVLLVSIGLAAEVGTSLRARSRGTV